MPLPPDIQFPIPAEMDEIAHIYEEMGRKSEEIPSGGVLVDYLDLKLLVYPGVFWPWQDSQPLVENMVINLGDHVLDVCTGAGTIGIMAALRGAGRVLALDIDPNAVRCARLNARRLGVDRVFEVRPSDVFSEVLPEETFNVITMNPPFSDRPVEYPMQRTMHDERLHVHRAFFAGVREHLRRQGRVYLSQANFGNITDMARMAEDVGFELRCIGERKLSDFRHFYAFELTLTNL